MAMRVLIGGAYGYLAGGTETYLKALLSALAGRGHEVAYFSTEPSPGRQPFAGECPVTILGARPEIGTLVRWAPQIVYLHGITDLDLEDAILDRYPAVLFAHGYFGTCATGQKAFFFPRVHACTRRFGPMCLLMHYPRRCGGLNPMTAVRGYLLQARRNRNLQRYAAIAVASHHMADEFEKHGISSNRVHHLPLPITSGTRDPTPPERRLPRGRLLMVGRLTKNKGGEYLLRAIPLAARQLAANLTLTIAGTGPEQAHLEALARQLKLEVTFAGWVDSKRVVELMRDADLLAVPSLWPEPFGLVGLEAAGIGLPAVAYDIGGVSDWLVAGESGELAPSDPPSAAGLARTIVRALVDPEHYAKLRRAAWDRSAGFDMASHLASLESIFAKVLDAHKSPS